MRIFLAAALIALMAGSANAQGRGGPANGNAAKPKSPALPMTGADAAVAARWLRTLTLREKVAQLFVIGVES